MCTIDELNWELQVLLTKNPKKIKQPFYARKFDPKLFQVLNQILDLNDGSLKVVYYNNPDAIQLTIKQRKILKKTRFHGRILNFGKIASPVVGISIFVLLVFHNVIAPMALIIALGIIFVFQILMVIHASYIDRLISKISVRHPHLLIINKVDGVLFFEYLDNEEYYFKGNKTQLKFKVDQKGKLSKYIEPDELYQALITLIL